MMEWRSKGDDERERERETGASWGRLSCADDWLSWSVWATNCAREDEREMRRRAKVERERERERERDRVRVRFRVRGRERGRERHCS